MKKAAIILCIINLVVNFYLITQISQARAMVSSQNETFVQLNQKTDDVLSNLLVWLNEITPQPKELTVTAYTPSTDECDMDPNITASMQKVRPGTVAVSRDLFNQGWVFGKKIYIEGYGIFEITDLMNKRWIERIDIVMFSKKEAKKFGVKQRKVALLNL